MATTSTVTLSGLIDETLDFLYRGPERPARVVMGPNDLADGADTTFTLTDGKAQKTMIVEFGAELMLVTAVSSDASPIYTVARGYLGTATGPVPNGTAGVLNPAYPRYTVRRAVERSLRTLDSKLPNITSGVFTRDPAHQFITMPANTIDVFEVGHLNTINGRFDELSNWRFFEDLPTIKASTTKLLRISSIITDTDELIVKYQTPYAFSPATEAGTVALPIGGEDLPALWAVARIVSGREISRGDIDTIEEWNHDAAIRGGVNLRQIQALWQDFYRRLDEVRSIQNLPKVRPYRKIPRFIA